MDDFLASLPLLLAIWLLVAAGRGMFVLFSKNTSGVAGDELDDPLSFFAAALFGILWPLELLAWLFSLPGRMAARIAGRPAPARRPTRKRLKRARKGRK